MDVYREQSREVFAEKITVIPHGDFLYPCPIGYRTGGGTVEQLAAWVWGPHMMVLFLSVGICMTIATRWVQVRKLGTAFQNVWQKASGNKQGVSSFQAVCTALAATVGTGNIAGVAGALTLGGPGAVFWMWVSAVFGMATKYAEVVLSMKYRTRGPDGQWQSGPMYYIGRVLGKKWDRLGTVFALGTVLVSLTMGNLTQVNTMASAAAEALPQWKWVPLAAGVAAALLVIGITTGGAVRIGTVMERTVPVLVAVYLLGSLGVIAVHHQNLGPVFRSIFLGAFTPQAVTGGAAGIGLQQTIRWGVSRGVFSNEAGLGSAPIVHGMAEAEPEQQGLMGVFEVFVDTIVLCTLTALTILCSGISLPYGEASGAELASRALQTTYGGIAPGLLAVVLALLALTSIISWNLYGSRCAAFLWGSRGERWYRVLFPSVMILGAVMEVSAAWTAADLCNGLMALPNLLVLLAMVPKWGKL